MELSQKIHHAREIRSERGNIELAKIIVWFLYSRTIRKFLPPAGYYELAGISVHEKKKFDTVIPGNPYKDAPDHEWALIEGLREYVESGDSVVVVGAGSGTTSVVAAEKVSQNGKVIAYDGGAKRVEQSRKTVRINGVDDRCQIIHAIVGPAIHVTSSESADDFDYVHPADLPACDVLELDCEGAEKAILEQMTITPRVVIAETHPHFDSSPNKIQEILAERGYEIQSVTDRESVPVLIAQRSDSG